MRSKKKILRAPIATLVGPDQQRRRPRPEPTIFDCDVGLFDGDDCLASISRMKEGSRAPTNYRARIASVKGFFSIFRRRPPGVLVLSPDTKVESFSGKEFGVRSKGVICRMAIKKKLPEPLDFGLFVSGRSYLVLPEVYPNALEYVALDHDQMFLHLFPVPRTHISADWNRNGSRGAWTKLNFFNILFRNLRKLGHCLAQPVCLLSRNGMDHAVRLMSLPRIDFASWPLSNDYSSKSMLAHISSR